jgi:hypothetical protein
MKYTLLAEIATALDAITPAEIDRARSVLGPLQEGEELIMVIDDPEAHRLWTLAEEYERKHDLAAHACRFDAKSKEERNQIGGQANRLHALKHIARHLAWTRMGDVAGLPILDQGLTFGLCENFSLISAPSSPSRETLLGAALMDPDTMRSVSGLLEMMIRRSRRGSEDPEETEKKPQ